MRTSIRNRLRMAKAHTMAKVSTALVVGFVAVGAALIASPGTAFAGSDGQQVDFNLAYCGGGLQWASISGTNQWGNAATWSGTASNDYVFPGGWWWFGNITVTYLQDGSWHYVHAYIPQGNDGSFQYWSNIVLTDCHGSWRYETSTVYSGIGINSTCVNGESDPLGYFTQYTRYSGYYGYTWNEQISPNGYSIAGNGTAPWLVTSRVSLMDCDD